MSTALDKAFYTAMTNDQGAGGVNNATTGCTGGFHNPVAPPTTTGGFPRIHYQQLVTVPEFSFSSLANDVCWYQFQVFAVDGNSEGMTIAKTLAERVRTLFTSVTLSLTGKTMLYCRPDRTLPSRAEWDGAKLIYSEGVIIEARIV